jgi:hypothetical protein
LTDAQLLCRPLRRDLRRPDRQPDSPGNRRRDRREPGILPAVLPDRRSPHRAAHSSRIGLAQPPAGSPRRPIPHRYRTRRHHDVHLTRLEPVGRGQDRYRQHHRGAPRHVTDRMSRRRLLHADLRPNHRARQCPPSAPRAGEDRRCADHSDNRSTGASARSRRSGLDVQPGPGASASTSADGLLRVVLGGSSLAALAVTGLALRLWSRRSPTVEKHGGSTP